jgi:hypothetical protein
MDVIMLQTYQSDSLFKVQVQWKLILYLSWQYTSEVVDRFTDFKFCPVVIGGGAYIDIVVVKLPRVTQI